jgi:pyruvate,water dikinase
VIARLLSWSRRLLPQRENAKLPIVRVFDDTRRLLTAVAPRLVERGALPDTGAVHYLRYQELKAILGGGAGPGAGELQRRRQAHLRCLQLELPELVEAGPGWIRPLDDQFIRRLGLLVPAKIAASVRRLDGIGASPGVLTGTARVMLDPYADFEPGEVVIAKSVDPGWAPILACAGAVVLDSGGLLCHGAVVARELGIPCVVGVRAATALAQTGVPITVDGSAGTVQW